MKKFPTTAVIFVLCLVALFFWEHNYEKETRLSYDAWIEPVDYQSLKIYCVADVIKSGSQYNIITLHMPFGHTLFCEDEALYDWKRNDNTIRLSCENDWYRVSVVLGDAATEGSLQKIDSLYVRNIGVAYGSKQSDTFHFDFSDAMCPHGRTISAENKIYFYDVRDADILGYTKCKWCNEHLNG